MKQARHSEGAFETVIEAHLLSNGYVREPEARFDRERSIFPETVLEFIRDTPSNVTASPFAWPSSRPPMHSIASSRLATQQTALGSPDSCTTPRARRSRSMLR